MGGVPRITNELLGSGLQYFSNQTSITLAVGRPGQVLEVKSQRLFQIRYSFLFSRTATSQPKIGAPRDENTVFLGDHIVRVLFAFPGIHGEKCVAAFKELIAS